MKPTSPPPPGTKIVSSDAPYAPSLHEQWRDLFYVVMRDNQLNARNLTQPEILFKVLRCWAPATFPSSCHVFMHLLYSKEFKWDNGHLVLEEFRPDAFARKPALTENGWEELVNQHPPLLLEPYDGRYTLGSALLSIPEDASKDWLQHLEVLALRILGIGDLKYAAMMAAYSFQTNMWANIAEAAEHFYPKAAEILTRVEVVMTRIKFLLDREARGDVLRFRKLTQEKKVGDRVKLSYGTEAAFINNIIKTGEGRELAILDRPLTQKGVEPNKCWELYLLEIVTEEEAPLSKLI